MISRKSSVHLLSREHLVLKAMFNAGMKRIGEAVVRIHCRISKLQAACHVEESLHNSHYNP